MKKAYLGIALLAVLFVSGCIESTTLLDLNRDGSGRIVVREFMSPQITQMMEGMGGMFSGMQPEGADATSTPPPKTDMFKDMIEGNLEKFGEGVKLVSSKRMNNKQGWKGYEAVYSFDDVNAITIAIGDMEAQDESADMGEGVTAESDDSGSVPQGMEDMLGDTESEESGSDTVYSFNYTAGQPATLEIVPVVDEEIADAGEDAQSEIVVLESTTEMDEGMDEMASQMMGGMGAMMGPMLKGMRMTFLVRVDGDITETNSAHKWTKRPNTITVMDMQVDKMIGNPKAMELLQNQDEDSLAKIEEMNIKGIKLEPPTKTIKVTF